jgi:hypothetical protein
LAISCPTTSFCLATDDAGNALVTANPTGGPSAWTAAQIDPNIPVFLPIVSCVSRSLCLTVDEYAGNVLVTRQPLTGAGSWSLAALTPPRGGLPIPGAVSCPSMFFCMVLAPVTPNTNQRSPSGTWAYAGRPSAGPSTWVGRPMDKKSSVTAVSCPTVSVCVAVDLAGNAVVGRAPTRHAVTRR